jgi:hypothetical protein
MAATISKVSTPRAQDGRHYFRGEMLDIIYFPSAKWILL